MGNRENFKSTLGFILVSAGCAIGIGNVWKFPYVAGANGGGVFVLFYLLFLLIMGIPVLTMELAVGRASRQSAVGSYKALEKKGHKWHIHGWFCVAGCSDISSSLHRAPLTDCRARKHRHRSLTECLQIPWR